MKICLSFVSSIQLYRQSVTNLNAPPMSSKEFRESASAVKQLLSLIFSFRNCSGFKRDFICMEAGIIWNNTAVAARAFKDATRPRAGCRL